MRAPGVAALAGALAATALAAPAGAATLREELVRAGVAPPAEATDLDREITGHALLDDGETLTIVYYRRPAEGSLLPDELHVRVLDLKGASWRHRELPRVREASPTSPGWTLGSVVEVLRGRGQILLETHLTPSAGTVLVLTPDLEPVAALPGWVHLVLADGFVVFEHSQVHFAPTYAAEIWGFDPATGRSRLLHPRPPWGPLRARYVEEVRRTYQGLGEGWFRVHNHHMDPERFDSAVLGRVVAGDDADSIAFVARFGGGEGTPAATPALDVVVDCRGLHAAPTCRERALAELVRHHPGLSGPALLAEVLAAGPPDPPRGEQGSAPAICSFTTAGGSRTTAITGGGSCDLHVAAALSAAFPAPGATWVPVPQPFWPHHRVFELATVGDPRWYQRPTVALDPGGGTHLLTDGVSRVPPAVPLARFNAITAAERPTVDASNAEAYAAFFLSAHLLYRDDTCLAPDPPEVPDAGLPIPATACSRTPGFRLTRAAGGFLVETVLVHRTGRRSAALSFHLAPDGRVRPLP